MIAKPLMNWVLKVPYIDDMLLAQIRKKLIGVFGGSFEQIIIGGAAMNKEGIGELVVRGDNVMLGYYKNEEATKASFTEDGWLRTGDLGYADKNNNIFIKGRNKTMLLGPSGQNIYPEEIEDKLNNMPFVMESIVIQRDNKIVALIHPDIDTCDAAGLDSAGVARELENVRKEVNKSLAAYEQISQVIVHIQEFEKTPKKSIKRYLYSE